MSLGQLELQNCTAYANSSGGFHYDQTGVSFIIRSRRSPKLRFFDVKNCAFPLKLNLSFFSFKSCIASVMAKTGFYSRLELGRFHCVQNSISFAFKRRLFHYDQSF